MSAPTGRVVLVTGAARGIGAVTVRRLVAQGDHVVAVDELAVAEAHDQVVPVVADVRDRAALAAAVDTALDR